MKPTDEALAILRGAKKPATVAAKDKPAAKPATDAGTLAAERAPSSAKLQVVVDKDTRWEWQDDFIKNRDGSPAPILANAIITLKSAPEWKGVLIWNQFSLLVTTSRPCPWGAVETWSDIDSFRFREWCQHIGLRITNEDANAAVEIVAANNPIHPVRQYMTSLKWDGISRIYDWLTLYLGVEPSDLASAVGAKWLISGVARIMEPGCQADHALILEGPQGQGKSTALRIVGEPYFTDDLPDLGTKDASQSTVGLHVVELSELGPMRAAAAAKVKSFITRRVDRFRPPYGKRFIKAPRQCILAGTVNDRSYLVDETGGRRFWPVECGAINTDALRRDRDQIWAEAVFRYTAGEPWFLKSPELIQAATREQEERYQTDPWENVIADWLYRAAPSEFGTTDVLRDALRKDIGQWSRADETRVGIILKRLKCELGPRRADSRRRIYLRP